MQIPLFVFVCAILLVVIVALTVVLLRVTHGPDPGRGPVDSSSRPARTEFERHSVLEPLASIIRLVVELVRPVPGQTPTNPDHVDAADLKPKTSRTRGSRGQE